MNCFLHSFASLDVIIRYDLGGAMQGGTKKQNPDKKRETEIDAMSQQSVYLCKKHLLLKNEKRKTGYSLSQRRQKNEVSSFFTVLGGKIHKKNYHS